LRDLNQVQSVAVLGEKGIELVFHGLMVVARIEQLHLVHS
jgi:hypothetical protein